MGVIVSTLGSPPPDPTSRYRATSDRPPHKGSVSLPNPRYKPYDGRGPSFLRELCISLTGRWEPDRLFMIFNAQIDEADTHGPTPDMTMSAMLGTGRQWELFGRGLRRLQKEYGFKILHATEFKKRTGEFAGWSEDKGHTLYRQLGTLVDDNLTEAVS